MKTRIERGEGGRPKKRRRVETNNLSEDDDTSSQSAEERMEDEEVENCKPVEVNEGAMTSDEGVESSDRKKESSTSLYKQKQEGLSQVLSTQLPALETYLKQLESVFQKDKYNINFEPYVKQLAQNVNQLKSTVSGARQFYNFVQSTEREVLYEHGYFGVLPTEIIYEIFSHIDDGRSLCRAGEVCSLFRSLSLRESLWQALLTKPFPSCALEDKFVDRSWKWLYLSRFHKFPKNSVKTGVGYFRFETGNVYYGEWLNDQRHGKGIGIMADGRKYMGEWEKDKRKGWGIFTWPLGKCRNGGDRYEGQWKESKRHGKGTYIWAEGTIYDGTWQDGVRHGFATCTRSTGVKYTGDYQMGKLEGTGTMTWADGSMYMGQFSNGRRHGIGTHVGVGWTFHGGWVGQKRHGKGTMRLEVGKGVVEQYQGEWREDKICGNGTYVNKEGEAVTKEWTCLELAQFCISSLPPTEAGSQSLSTNNGIGGAGGNTVTPTGGGGMGVNNMNLGLAHQLRMANIANMMHHGGGDGGRDADDGMGM